MIESATATQMSGEESAAVLVDASQVSTDEAETIWGRVRDGSVDSIVEPKTLDASPPSRPPPAIAGTGAPPQLSCGSARLVCGEPSVYAALALLLLLARRAHRARESAPRSGIDEHR
jgi:hypothetical protein